MWIELRKRATRTAGLLRILQKQFEVASSFSLQCSRQTLFGLLGALLRSPLYYYTLLAEVQLST